MLRTCADPLGGFAVVAGRHDSQGFEGWTPSILTYIGCADSALRLGASGEPDNPLTWAAALPLPPTRSGLALSVPPHGWVWTTHPAQWVVGFARRRGSAPHPGTAPWGAAVAAVLAPPALRRPSMGTVRLGGWLLDAAAPPGDLVQALRPAPVLGGTW